MQNTQQLDALHHVAIEVKNIAESIDWYQSKFRCNIKYQDETWALLEFQNVDLALVLPHQHPPHLAFSSVHAEEYGQLKSQRDGPRSVYIRDNSDNTVELMAIE